MEEYTINIRRNAIEAIQTLLLVGGELGEQLESEELMNDVEKYVHRSVYVNIHIHTMHSHFMPSALCML